VPESATIWHWQSQWHPSAITNQSKHDKALAVALGCILFLTGGCGESAPFKIAPVSGDVKYSDGSPIKADRIVISFVPQNVPPVGKQAAAAANGEVNPADGSFASLTTHDPEDGAIIGRHKVLVRALNKSDELTAAVDARFTRLETTPLEADVQPGKENRFSFVVEPAKAGGGR
jgi:hypothetical protein